MSVNTDDELSNDDNEMNNDDEINYSQSAFHINSDNETCEYPLTFPEDFTLCDIPWLYEEEVVQMA